MSFLSDNHSEFLSARITQKGRNAIAKGNFNIEYFQIGDSEFDYNTNFKLLTGSLTHQKVFSPLDYNTNVKYPIGYDSNLTTTYGTPIEQQTSYTIRNVMGPAGFVSGSVNGSMISCITDILTPLEISGGTIINVTSGNTFQNCEYVTLVLGNVGDGIIDSNFNSLIYKVTSISGNTLNLDRPLPNLSSTSITGTVICNNCEIEYPTNSLPTDAIPYPVDTQGQLNPWTLNTVWTTKPIGADYGSVDENLDGYVSNRFVSTKEYLGYTTGSQLFTNLNGNTITFNQTGSLIYSGSLSMYSGFSSTSMGSGFANSYNELIEVSPKEQRCVAIIHYSELGDTITDTERFFKYDDYIGHLTGTTDTVTDEDISDTDYFEVYIPFICYHRNSSTGTTYGAYFTMDNIDYYIKPTTGLTESRFQLKYRYLLDESGFIVGKVFVNNKIIVFDDQELVALLDYRSNRRFTLPAPKITTTPSDSLSNSLITGTTGQTYWVTYMLANETGSESSNYLPCNYYSKVEVNYDSGSCNTSFPSNISLKFNTGSFNHLGSNNSINYTAKYFYGLVQKVSSQNVLPEPNSWKIMNMTGYTSGSLISKTDLENKTFTITKNMYDSASPFDLESYMSGNNYLGVSGSMDYNITIPQFGDEQPFPGSVKLIRASDVEQMNFLINLPSNNFTTSQNPTFISGSNVMISEVSLLDSNKETLVVAKTSTPIKRIGTQVFGVKLDF
jgi:hypothetical protein